MFFKNNLYNIIFAFYVLFCLILLTYYYYTEYLKNKTEEFSTGESRTRYILWNGDIDSTYRLFYLLSKTDDIVQPLFLLSGNQESNMYKLKIMKKIRNKIKNTISEKDFSKLKKIKKITKAHIYNPEIFPFEKYIKSKILKNKLHLIANYAKQKKITIEITLNKKEQKEHNYIKYITKTKNQYLSFPLLNKLRSSYKKLENADAILQLTWSCINPNAKTGDNCNDCLKCKSKNNS